MTEVGWVTTFPFPELFRDDSVGRVLDGFKVQIVDDSNISADNEAGELLIRAPAPMLDYLGNEKATVETPDRHGRVKSGDIGSRSHGKIYVLTGRKASPRFADGRSRQPKSKARPSLIQIPLTQASSASICQVPVARCPRRT